MKPPSFLIYYISSIKALNLEEIQSQSQKNKLGGWALQNMAGLKAAVPRGG